MTIGNLPHSERTKRQTYSVVLIGWLPTPPKIPENYTATEKAAKSLRDRQIVQSAIRAVLSPLLDTEGCRYTALCADGRWRLCWSPLAAWIADYPEYVSLLGLKYGDCIWCETPHCELQDFPPANPARQFEAYQTLWNTNTAGSIAELVDRGVNPSHNILWECGSDVGLLAKPDILHGLQLGILDYMLQWTLRWLKDVGLRTSLKRLWLSVPAYCEMAKPIKTYLDVSQYQGGEYRTVARFFYSILQATLETAKPKDNDEKRDFKDVLACVESMLDFHFYACYKEHSDSTLDCMYDALQRFHDFRHVFLRYRADKATRKAAMQARKERNERRKKDFGNNPKHRGYAAFQRQTDAEYLTMLETSAHFNIPKVHHCGHYVDQVRLFGSLVGYNSSITENCHIVFCKNPYRSSNKVGEYVRQILQTTSRRESFAIQRLNYDTWQRRRSANHNGADSSSNAAKSRNGAPDRDHARSNPTTVPVRAGSGRVTFGDRVTSGDVGGRVLRTRNGSGYVTRARSGTRTRTVRGEAR
jgi:hypothetical protein